MQVQLHHHALLAAEKIFTAEKIEFPYADEARTIKGFNLCMVLQKPEALVPQRLGIMTPHHLHIGDFQAPSVGCANKLFNRWRIAARKYVFRQLAIDRRHFALDGDGVYHSDSVRSKQTGHLVEIGVVISRADMFEHADGHHPVKMSLLLQVV